MAKLSVIIPAAGSGERMGSKLPKPFIKIHEKPILFHTISKFLEISDVMQIIIAVSPENISKVKAIISTFDKKEVFFEVSKGGEERQLSVFKALDKVSEEAELVAVHDAVRPFVSPKHIKDCIKVAKKEGGAVLGVPSRDTIKNIDTNNFITSTPDRSKFWLAQTPQIFRKTILMEAYRTAFSTDYIGTDDASLVERIDKKVRMVRGSHDNLKITFPEDLLIAQSILNNKDDSNE